MEVEIRERFGDDTLLALKMKEEAIRQGMLASYRS